MHEDPFANYRLLLARVEAHAQQVSTRIPLHCQRGCTACCYVRLSVSRVEADFITSHHPRRPDAPAFPTKIDAHPLFDQLRGPEPCVFLGASGDCSIYEMRPLICRSHGLPIQQDGARDICPLNEEGSEAAPALNLELLNTTLAAIDAHYCKQTGRPIDRVPLESISSTDASHL